MVDKVILICQICGKKFERWPRTVYCSQPCEDEGGRIKQKGYRTAYLKTRFDIFKRDNFKCIYCGRGVKDGTILEIEHILPRSKGGDLTPENLATACYECNRGKGDILLSERNRQKTTETI